MTTLAPVAKFQAIDSSGNPISGGLVYTYASGTSTPLATYTDQGGGTQNANPVVCDSGGFADIWLASGSEYRFTLKTAGGATVWGPIDHISGYEPTTIRVQEFVAGSDFTAGSSTTLTLTYAPASENNVDIYFDGVYQLHSQYSVSSTTITFTAAIPVAVALVEVKYSVNLTSQTFLTPADIGVTVQAYDANIAFLNVVQSWTKAQRGTPVALTSSGAAIAIDMSLGNNFSHTMTEDTTIGAPSNMVAGQSGAILITQHASAAKTLAFNAAWVLPRGT
jgi:hypothetical protein